MTTAVEMSLGNDTPIATSEPTDDALIAKAKGLNKEMDRHLRKGIEAFYRLGETLTALYKRRHLHHDGRWKEILKEINISTTTDSYARRFSQSCEFADLGDFKNKTEALRKLGIIANPDHAKRGMTVGKAAPASPCIDGLKAESAGEERHDTPPVEEVGNIADEPLADAEGVVTQVGEEDHVQRTAGDGSLDVLAKIATLLESLANEGIAPTADHQAQLDRIAAAVARLKGVALVAAA